MSVFIAGVILKAAQAAPLRTAGLTYVDADTDQPTPDQLRNKAADLLKAAQAAPLRPLLLTYVDPDADGRGPDRRRAAARSGDAETTRFFSVAEAAAELRLSEETVYGLCKTRKMRHERHGLGRGKILIPADALDEYRRSVTVEAERPSAPPPNPKSSPGSFKHLRV